MGIRWINQCAALLAAVTLGSIFTTTSAWADGPLRWKFKVGEKLNYKMVQDMTMTASGPQLPELKTTMRQEMDMTWDVQGVDEASGEAVIRQKFDQITMKMTTPGGEFQYDSKSEEAPMGLGAMIAPMYKAMTEGEFEITMTSRGEVKEVKIPQPILDAFKNSPNAAQMGDMATAEGFKKMISQGAMVLPKDTPKKGDEWKTTVDMQNPAVGKQSVETTYRYEGTKDVKGTKYAVFNPQMKMEFENKSNPQTKIKDQSSEGEVLFNIEEGRLHSTTLKQNVTITTSQQGQPVELNIDQKIDVTVTPAGEKKPGEESKPESEKKE